MKFSIERLAEIAAEEYTSVNMELDHTALESLGLWAHYSAEQEYESESKVRDEIRSKIKTEKEKKED